jgi:hypothetical protein
LDEGAKFNGVPCWDGNTLQILIVHRHVASLGILKSPDDLFPRRLSLADRTPAELLQPAVAGRVEEVELNVLARRSTVVVTRPKLMTPFQSGRLLAGARGVSTGRSDCVFLDRALLDRFFSPAAGMGSTPIRPAHRLSPLDRPGHERTGTGGGG